MSKMLSNEWFGVGMVTLVGLLVLFFVPLVFDLFQVLQMTQYIVLSIYALSLAYMWGFGGILSFGQAGFFGLGGYAYAVLAINMGHTTGPFMMAICLCFLFAMALGYFMFYGRSP